VAEIPRATVRLQLHADFDFGAVAVEAKYHILCSNLAAEFTVLARRIARLEADLSGLTDIFTGQPAADPRPAARLGALPVCVLVANGAGPRCGFSGSS